MAQVCTACKGFANLIHAMATPKDSPSPEREGVIYYVVDLEPLGVPLLSKYSDHRPKNQAELKSLTKYDTFVVLVLIALSCSTNYPWAYKGTVLGKCFLF